MKGIDLLCTSPASTAICATIDQHHSMVQHSLSRAIDRHNPHLSDPRRRPRTNKPLLPPSIPSSSSTPSSSSSSSSCSSSQQPKKPSYHDKKGKKKKSTNKSSSSAAKPANKDFVNSPSTSSRYLLSDSVFFDVTEFEPDYALVTLDNQNVKEDDLLSLKPSSSSSSPHNPSSSSTSHHKPPSFSSSHHKHSSPSSSCSYSSTRSQDEVVVLKVSLHCRGCEGKVRKHISKMQGVKSFKIDFATKKVTVVGDLTPSDVLASVSRVKNAQLWPSPSPSPLLSSSSSSVKLIS